MKLPATNMDNPSKIMELGITDLRVAAVLAFVILNLAVFLIRVVSVWRYGALFFSVGGDAEVVYPVWKAVHHLPVFPSTSGRMLSPFHFRCITISSTIPTVLY